MQHYVGELLAVVPARHRTPIPADWDPAVAEGRIVPGSGNHPEFTRREAGPLRPALWHTREPSTGPHGQYNEEPVSTLNLRRAHWLATLPPADRVCLPAATAPRQPPTRPDPNCSYSSSGAHSSSAPQITTRAVFGKVKWSEA